MVSIKAYTDIEQSKVLSKILPPESADMGYNGVEYRDVRKIRYDNVATTIPNMDSIPCWSLAALLGVIPQEIFDGEYILNITEGCDDRWVLTYDHYENRNHSFYGLSTGADNLIDACVAIVEKLNERKML